MSVLRVTGSPGPVSSASLTPVRSASHSLLAVRWSWLSLLQLVIPFSRWCLEEKHAQFDDMRESGRWTKVFFFKGLMVELAKKKNSADLCALSLMWTATRLRPMLIHGLVWQFLLLWQCLNIRLSPAACWSHKLQACLIYSTLTICSKQLLNDPP